MIKSILIATMFSTSNPQETDDLKRNMKALEIFLQDKADHKEFCPKIKWSQPDIEVYKKELKSQLPADCKK